MIPAGAGPLADWKLHLVALSSGDLVARMTVHPLRREDTVPVKDQWFAQAVLDLSRELLPSSNTNGRPGHSAVDGRHCRGVTGPDGEIRAAHREQIS